MPDTAIPYETDWYAWTQDQAERLRALPAAARSNGLDLENLAEEVEDLGKSERRSVSAFLRQIMRHLLKIEFHPEVQARAHWRVEVSTFRVQLADIYRDSPSLRARRDETAREIWPGVLKEIRRELAYEAPDSLTALDAAAAADAPRYGTDSQLLNEDWFPG